ncbi:MAG: CPBP family intramembrane metalloprotease [Flavobacterium sp.]|nr:CPBP family intramembrane metalloprotease [Flavobacterium sp.]
MENINSQINGWIRILSFILPYIFVAGAFQFIGAMILDVNIADINSIKTTFQDFILNFFGLIGLLLVLWLFMKYVDNEKFINLGFHLKNKSKHFYLGVFLGFFIMGFAYLLLSQIDEIKYVKTIFKIKEILLSLGLFIIVAINEEVLMRGYVLRNLMYSFNKYIALIFSSFLFSLMHGLNPNMDWFSYLNLFLAGILLGSTYIFTKNLWFPIALHFSWNFFQSLFGFKVSGQDYYSLIEFKIVNPNIINGGLFGFEGSIFCIVIQLILITSILIYYNKSALYNIIK